MNHLQTILTIQHMAERAAAVSDEPNADQGREMAGAYVRLYAQARRLTEDAGWSIDEFEATLAAPPEDWSQPVVRTRDQAYALAGNGRRAQVLLGQLAGWAAGHAAAVALQAQIDAQAAAASRGPVGFAGKAA